MNRRLLITEPAFVFLRNATSQEQEKARRAFGWLTNAPEPDGQARRALGFPHRPGTYGALYDDLWLLYTYDDYELVVLAVQRAAWLP